MNGARAPGAVADFGGLDFDRLWRGRSKTTSVESEVLSCALDHVDPARCLEVGAGTGRLSGVIRARAREFVGTDLTRPFLERGDPSGSQPFQGLRAVANVYRLPFQDASFSGVVMARVFNFLAEPAAALQELRRVLVPGGSLIIAYQPRPSLGTLAGDVRACLGARPEGFRSATFTRDARVKVVPSPFPAWAPTRAWFAQVLEESGFQPRLELGTGLEDFRPFRWMPTAVFGSLARGFGGSVDGFFPTRFVLADVPRSRGTSSSLRELAGSLGCPTCSTPFPPVDLAREWERSCAGCGFSLRFRGGILDALDPAEGGRSRSLTSDGVASDRPPGQER